LRLRDLALGKVGGLDLSIVEEVAGVVGDVVSSGEDVGHEEEELGLDVLGGGEKGGLSLRNADVLSLGTGSRGSAEESAATVAARGVALLAVEAGSARGRERDADLVSDLPVFDALSDSRDGTDRLVTDDIVVRSGLVAAVDVEVRAWGC